MSEFTEQIENITGAPCPRPLADLFNSNRLRDLCPVVLRFPNVEWILDIMLVHDAADHGKYDLQNRRFEFGLNGDGFPLLIDLKNDQLEILQNEFDDIDSLGISAQDMLDSIDNKRYTQIK